MNSVRRRISCLLKKSLWYLTIWTRFLSRILPSPRLLWFSKYKERASYYGLVAVVYTQLEVYLRIINIYKCIRAHYIYIHELNPLRCNPPPPFNFFRVRFSRTFICVYDVLYGYLLFACSPVPSTQRLPPPSPTRGCSRIVLFSGHLYGNIIHNEKLSPEVENYMFSLRQKLRRTSHSRT